MTDERRLYREPGSDIGALDTIYLHYVPINHSITLYISFENKIQPSEGGAIGGAIEELTDRQIEILKLIERNSKISYRKVSELLKINYSAAKAHFDALKEKGIITRIGGTRGYWKIIYQK